MRNRQWMIIHGQVKKLDATIHVPVAAGNGGEAGAEPDVKQAESK